MGDYIASDLPENDKDAWATPDWLYYALKKEFGFKVDVAANKQNAKCHPYITAQMDALKMDYWGDCWHGFKLAHRAVWINPPYSRGMIKAFMQKAYEQCVKYKITSVLLVPATPDAGWWPKNATEIRFITGGRVSFEHPVTGKTINGNTKGSAVIIFRYTDLGSGCVTRYVNRDRLRDIGDDAFLAEELMKAGVE